MVQAVHLGEVADIEPVYQGEVHLGVFHVQMTLEVAGVFHSEDDLVVAEVVLAEDVQAEFLEVTVEAGSLTLS